MCHTCIFCLASVVGGNTNGTIDFLPDVAAGKTAIATVCVCVTSYIYKTTTVSKVRVATGNLFSIIVLTSTVFYLHWAVILNISLDFTPIKLLPLN
jgi:hypothetical protein